jgi:hypothetical protein
MSPRMKILSCAALIFASPPAASAQPAPVPAPLASCNAHFEGTVMATWDANGRTMTLTQPFKFVDAGCHAWAVPAGAVVDGASIPQAAWSLVGGPFEGRYRDASVVHDWYCAIRTEPSEKVHRMFYDAMRASGVESWRASVFYYAVRKAGPQWDDLTVRNSRLATGQLPPALLAPGTAAMGAFARTDTMLREEAPAAAHAPAGPAPVARPAEVTAGELRNLEAVVQARNLSVEDVERLAAPPQ